MGNRYVAYCDILGFSNLVEKDFEKTVSIYKDFTSEIIKHNFLDVEISVYSDSILIVGENLFNVAQAVQILQWTTLRYEWLVRGCIAYGKYWIQRDENNTTIVSEGLVKAVKIEKEVKHPIVVISNDIPIGVDYWLHGFRRGIFDFPIIYYDDRNIVNPFNNYWFKSAEIILNKLKNEFPLHNDKHNYILNMIEDIKQGKSFGPQSIIDILIAEKVLIPIDPQA